MKFTLILFTIAFAFTATNSEKTPFLRFNKETLKHVDETTCRDPQFFIDMANFEESKPDNQNKIILYHGESYGSWLFQLILKAFMFPEAPEDWLPLRDKPLDKEIDRTDLMKLIDYDFVDHESKYSKIGLSVSPNLVSRDGSGESAWFFICGWPEQTWHKLKGLNQVTRFLHSSLYRMIKMKFIPVMHWSRFDKQKKLLNKFIQVKRGLKQIKDASSLYKDIQKLFPSTFDRYKEHLKSLPKTLENYKSKEKDNIEGVVLQIIMEKELADSLTYSSKKYGFVKSKKHEKYAKYEMPWEGEDIEPFSDFYKEEKNKEDLTQARIALTNDFRSFPSRVRIKSIAGIMENHIDYDILKSMIKEMTKVNKKKDQLTSFNWPK